MSPRWVKVILEHQATWVCARIALVCAYLIGGLTKLFDFPGAVAEQAHFGLHPPELWAAVTIVVELGGSTASHRRAARMVRGRRPCGPDARGQPLCRELLDHARPRRICSHERLP